MLTVCEGTRCKALHKKRGCVIHTVFFFFRQFGLGVHGIYLLTFGDRNSRAVYQPVVSMACFVDSFTDLLKMC